MHLLRATERMGAISPVPFRLIAPVYFLCSRVGGSSTWWFSCWLSFRQGLKWVPSTAQWVCLGGVLDLEGVELDQKERDQVLSGTFGNTSNVTRGWFYTFVFAVSLYMSFPFWVHSHVSLSLSLFPSLFKPNPQWLADCGLCGLWIGLCGLRITED